MSVPSPLHDKPPRSYGIASALSEPMTRKNRRRIYMMAVWSVGCGEMMFAIFHYGALWPDGEALLAGAAFSFMFAILVLPSCLTTLADVRAVARLARKGTLFMENIDDVEYKYPGGAPSESMRVRFCPDGIKRVCHFEMGRVAWNPGAGAVPVLFEPANPGVAALLLPDGTAIVGDVFVEGMEPE